MMDVHQSRSRADTFATSSDRTFGLVFTVVFAIVAFQPLLHQRPIREWAVLLSGAFVIAALVAPGILAPLNRAWTALGLLLHKVTNPIVLGALFYLVFAPMGWLVRRMNKNILSLRLDPDAGSYWIARQPPGPDPASMTNQY